MRLHEKYGVNATIPTCFYCGKSKNELILLGAASRRLTGQDEAPMHGPVFDKQPCDQCREYMKQGIILIEVRDGESGDNPYRTGGWWVVKEDAIREIFDDETVTRVMQSRVAFLEQRTSEMLGLRKHSDSKTG